MLHSPSHIRVRRMGEGREGGQIVPVHMGDPVGIITKRNDTVYPSPWRSFGLVQIHDQVDVAWRVTDAC